MLNNRRVAVSRLAACAAAALICCGAAQAQPVIRSVHNAADSRSVFAPGGALARGGLITIEGEGLGPPVAAEAEAGRAVEALGGVRVELRQDHGSHALLLLRAGARRIDAAIPKDAPVGVGSIVVTYDGGSSAARAPVAPSALSLFQTADLASRLREPFAPGSAVTIWGTGLGAASREDVEVFVGGVAARVLTAAAAHAPGGRDRIEIELPENAPMGCYTPVQARLYGTFPSNVITVPAGAPCERASENLRALDGKGLAGLVLLMRAEVVAEAPDLGGETASFLADSGFGAFVPADEAAGPLAPFVALPPLGACAAYQSAFDSSDMSDLPWRVWEAALGPTEAMSVGAIETAGARGRRAIAKDEPFERYADLLGGDHPYSAGPLPEYLEPGEYVVSGGGAEGVGRFEARVSMPLPLEWKRMDALETVDRTRPLVIEWEGGAGDAPAVVAGVGLDRRTRSGVLFLCREQASKGRFAVPAAILESIAPAGPSGRGHLGMILVGTGLADDAPVFEAEGLVFGTVVTLNVFGRSVQFR